VLFALVGLNHKKSDCLVPVNANLSSIIGLFSNVIPAPARRVRCSRNLIFAIAQYFLWGLEAMPAALKEKILGRTNAPHRAKYDFIFFPFLQKKLDFCL
jgi:hypothetical protein